MAQVNFITKLWTWSTFLKVHCVFRRRGFPMQHCDRSAFSFCRFLFLVISRLVFFIFAWPVEGKSFQPPFHTDPKGSPPIYRIASLLIHCVISLLIYTSNIYTHSFCYIQIYNYFIVVFLYVSRCNSL